MQVVLLDNIKGFGRKGEIKNVKDGYFLNFLQPKKLAILATPDAIKKAQDLKNKEVLEKEQIKEEAKLIQSKLEKLDLVLKRKTQGEKLYASITPKDLIEAVFEQLKIRLDKASFSSKLHIKNVGITSVEVKLSDEITATLKVEVKAE